MRRREIPTKRRQRMAIGWFILAVILLAVLIAAAAPRSEVYDIREDRLTQPISEETTIHPQEAEAWTRYDVPLDDDLQRYIYDLCRDYGVDMPLALAVIERESDFQADKIGDGGRSFGLMQIYASQHTERCIRLNAYNLLDARQNVRVGIDYLAELIGWGEGVEYALSFYNGHGGALPWYYVDEVQSRAAEIAETGAIVAK